MKLYEINEQITNIIDNMTLVEDEQLYDIMKNSIEQLELEEGEKIDNVLSYIKNLESETKAIKEEISKLNERAKSKEKKAERLKEFIFDYMRYTNKDKFESVRNVAKIVKTPARVIINDTKKFIFECEKSGLDHLLEYKEPAPSKTRIAEYLKEGYELDGARLESGTKLRIK